MNQTWDLSSMSSAVQTSVEYVATAGSAYAANFPDASYATYVTDGSDVNYVYYLDEGNSSSIKGIGSPNIVLDYSDPQQLFQFPISFGETFNDEFTSTFNSGGFEFVRAGTVTSEVDGFGTLVTPYGSITDVYRIKTINDYSDTNPTIGQFDYYNVNYYYFKANIHYYLASVQSLEAFGSVTEYVIYMDETSVGISELASNDEYLSVYPNPITSSAIIELLDNYDKDATLELFDYTGKKISDFDVSQLAFENSMTVDFSTISNGIYILKFSSQFGTSTQKVVVNK